MSCYRRKKWWRSSSVECRVQKYLVMGCTYPIHQRAVVYHQSRKGINGFPNRSIRRKNVLQTTTYSLVLSAPPPPTAFPRPGHNLRQLSAPSAPSPESRPSCIDTMPGPSRLGFMLGSFLKLGQNRLDQAVSIKTCRQVEFPSATPRRATFLTSLAFLAAFL